MNTQCLRCLSSSFPLVVANDPRKGCRFCEDQLVEDTHYFQKPARIGGLTLVVAQTKLTPSVLNGGDRTTSGAIGQP